MQLNALLNKLGESARQCNDDFFVQQWIHGIKKRKELLEGGLEPPQDCSHKHLKLACLPIPPPEREHRIFSTTLRSSKIPRKPCHSSRKHRNGWTFWTDLQACIMANSRKKNYSLRADVQKSVDSGNLMVSVSGIRGTLPGGFRPDHLAQFIQAFASITGNSIVLGNDARPSGPAIRELIQGILKLSGKSVLDTGLAPTPTVKAVVNQKKASAGIIVTASHNPIQWNGLKFLKKGGFFFGSSELESWKESLALATDVTVPPAKLGNTEKVDGISLHINSILKRIPNINQIRKKKYKVVVDAVNGAGREALPALLEALGCKVVRLNCEPSAGFARPPEPTPAALKEFGKLCQKDKVAAGFALDPDADRLVPGTAIAGAINEEYTLPLALMGFVQSLRSGTGKKKGSGVKQGVVVNLSSSLLTSLVAQEAGLPFSRSPVGEANVVESMLKTSAVFGGEGNGGVIDPALPSYGRDSLAGAAWILSAMAQFNITSLDGMLQNLPAIHMRKEKIEMKRPRIPEAFKKLKKSMGARANVDERDGLWLGFPEGWVHLRASNTEPVVRLIVEGRNATDLETLHQAARKSLGMRN